MMTEQGLVSNVFSYNMVIDCFCQTNMPERARLIRNKMQNEGIKPNLVTFNTLIGGYRRVRDICEAKEMLQILFSFRMRPVTFTTLIDALCRIKQPDNALNCLTEMGDWGITPIHHLQCAIVCSIYLWKYWQIYGSIEKNAKGWIFSRYFILQQSHPHLLQSMLVLGLAPDKTACNILLEALNSQEVCGCCEDFSFAGSKKDCALFFYCQFAWSENVETAETQSGSSIHPSYNLTWTCVGLESGFGQVGVFGQLGSFGQAGGIITKALSCFSDKYIYHNCEESYRLDQSGELHVPPEYVNEYCEGPCQKETGLVLNCLHGIFANFIFYNKATISVIKYTIHEGCSFGPERGDFNVAEHLQVDSSVSTDFTHQIVFSLTSILVGLMFII